jgi:PAS domain S-box-containing protein
MISKGKNIIEELYLMIDHHPDLMAILDIKGNIITINDRLASILGKSKEEIIANSRYNIFNKIVGEDTRKIIEKVKKYKKKIEIINQDNFYWWKTIFKPLMDSRGNVKRIAIYSQNISDKKQADNELRISEVKSRAILDAIPDLLFIIDKDGIFLDYSAEKRNLYVKPEIFLGKSVFDVLPKELAEKIDETINKISKKGKLHKFEYNLPIKNEIRYYEARAIGMGESDVLFIVHDITDSKIKTKQLQLTKDYIQNIIDSASEIIFTINIHNKIKTWNKTAEKITGFKRKNIIGKKINQLKIFENYEEIELLMKNLKNGKTEFLEELTINTNYGIKKLLSISPSYIKDEFDNINEILLICRDITKEKESEEKLITGNGYLLIESKNDKAIKLFNSYILNSKFKGLYVGRITIEEFQKNFIDTSPEIIKLTTQKDEYYSTSNNLKDIYQKINDFLNKNFPTIILLDRIDYLITSENYGSLIKFLYKINDDIDKKRSILLIRINPLIIDDKRINILKEEFQMLPSGQIGKIQLEESLLNIISFVNTETKRNTYVTPSKIGKEFPISKVTVQKRIEILKKMELLYSKKKGRSKYLFLTDKGKNFIQSRSAI